MEAPAGMAFMGVMARAGVMSRSMPSRMAASKMSASARVPTASPAAMLRGSRRDYGEQKTRKKGKQA
jgi:hypothetical protein